ncbi:MAG: hypothetical protein AAGE92_12720, partial [Cyanobacteria bacterium P01_G01_bin.4]
MQMLANPLKYPLATLAGGVLLVVGARGLNVAPPILVPVAIASSVGAATVLKQRDPNVIQLENPQLARELLDIRQSALALAEKAEGLQAESRHQLGDDTFHVELLAAVELACVRARLLTLSNGNAIMSDADASDNQLWKLITPVEFTCNENNPP